MHRFNLYAPRGCDFGTCCLSGRFPSKLYRVFGAAKVPFEVRRLCDHHANLLPKLDPAISLEVFPC